MPNAEIEGMNMAVKSTHSWVRVGTAASVAAVMALGTVPAAAFAGEANAGETAFEQAADQTTASVVLPEGVTVESFADDNTCVFKNKSGSFVYAKTLTEGLKAYYMDGPEGGETVLYCKPGADLGSMTHGHVVDNITIEGNGAYVSGGEHDIEVDTSVFSRETGSQTAVKQSELTGDLSITVNNLNGIAIWGERHSAYTINVVFNNCKNMNRAYISGTSGENYYTFNDCSFDGNSYANKGTVIYSNAVGSITVKNTEFKNLKCGINLNNKSGAKQTVSVSGCTFENCGTEDLLAGDANGILYSAPIRVLSTKGGSSELTVDGCTFAYGEGKKKVNGDILLGDGREGESAFPVTVSVSNTAAEVHVHNPGDSTKDGRHPSKIVNVTNSSTPTAVTNVVCTVNGTAYMSLKDAVDAAQNGATVKLSDDVTVSKTVTIDKDLTIDLAGHTLTGNDVRAIHVTAGAVTLTGEGTVTSVKPEGGKMLDTTSVIRVGDNSGDVRQASLTIGKDVTVKAPHCYGVGAFGGATKETVELYGAVEATSTASALAGNGTDTTTPTTIRLHEGSSLKATGSVAIYHPQAGTLTIDGASIEGLGGIESKGGSVDISITGNTKVAATGKISHEENNNGTSTSGYAISIAENKNYAGAAKVSIAAGEYVGAIDIVKDNEVAEDKKGSIAISGGAFTVDPSDFVVKNGTANFVKRTGTADSYRYEVVAKANLGEGVYLTDPTAALPSGYEVVAGDGVWTVSKKVVPPSGGGGGAVEPSDKTETVVNPDGSTTTTVTKPDGSSSATTTAKDGTEAVVQKDAEGNVTSTEVPSPTRLPPPARSSCPWRRSRPGRIPTTRKGDRRQGARVQTAESPVQVTVPGGQGGGRRPWAPHRWSWSNPDGTVTVLPKTAVSEWRRGRELEGSGGRQGGRQRQGHARRGPDDWRSPRGRALATARGIVNGVPQAGGLVFEATPPPTAPPSCGCCTTWS